MTELGMALSNSYVVTKERYPGHVGTAMPGVRAKLMDLETGDLHNTPGIESELLIQSKNCFDRYLNNPEETEKSFLFDKDGERWFKTGDCAIINGKNG